MKMPTATETAVELARKNELLEILLILKNAKENGQDLNEAIRIIESRR